MLAMLMMEPLPWASMCTEPVLVDEECALQVDVHHPVPLLLGDEVDRSAADDPGGVRRPRRGGRGRRRQRRNMASIAGLVPHVDQVVDLAGDIQVTTTAPSAASRSAQAAPMPDPAPVTTATEPSSRAIGLPFAFDDLREPKVPAARPVKVGSAGQAAEHVVADVTDQVDQVPALGEVPAVAVPGEPVVVAAGQDGLEGQAGHGLEDRPVRTGGGRTRLLVDLQDEVGGDVLGARRPVGVEPGGGGVQSRMASRPVSRFVAAPDRGPASRSATPSKSPRSMSSA